MKLSTLIRTAVLAVTIGVLYQATSHAGLCSFKGDGVLTSTITGNASIAFNGVYVDSNTVNIPYAELHYTLFLATGSVTGNETGHGTQQPRQVILDTEGPTSRTRLIMIRRGQFSNQAFKGTIALDLYWNAYYTGTISGELSCR